MENGIGQLLGRQSNYTKSMDAYVDADLWSEHIVVMIKTLYCAQSDMPFTRQSIVNMNYLVLFELQFFRNCFFIYFFEFLIFSSYIKKLSAHVS